MNTKKIAKNLKKKSDKLPVTIMLTPPIAKQLAIWKKKHHVKKSSIVQTLLEGFFKENSFKKYKNPEGDTTCTQQI